LGRLLGLADRRSAVRVNSGKQKIRNLSLDLFLDLFRCFWIESGIFQKVGNDMG
jgi:hypothetical protein